MSPPRSAVPSDRMDRLLERFERAWQKGTPPRVDDFLPAAGAPGRRTLLHELIPVDLEYRWRRSGQLGPPPRLEEYLRLYPELGPVEQLPAELIGYEYRARHCWGDRPGHAEYLARFPKAGSSLRDTLARVDADLTAEFRPGPPSAAPVNPTGPPPEAVRVTVAGLVAALGAGELLSTAALAELRRDLAGRFAEPRALCREMLRRGWLTPYQLNQLLQGRGQELVLGPYLLLERLGEGGAGQVFKARHRKLGRVVALKLIRKDLLADAEVVGRFYREIQIVGQLDHPNVVRAYDAGPAGASHFLAMEYVKGTDLARLVKQGGPLPIEQACEYIRQAACGLAHAHEKGLVHRDIKPHNLIMGLRDGLVKVADLGLARLPRTTGADATAALTAAQGTGTLTPENAVLIGTADYLAPEQALDFHAADIRADIYSLGCTFFYLLTGQPPFPAPTLAEKLMKHQQAEPPAVEQFRADLPAGLGAVLQRMLAKQPADRYQVPQQVAQVLGSPCASAPKTSAVLPNPVPPAPLRRRRRLLFIACAVGIAVVLAFGSWRFWDSSKELPTSLEGMTVSDAWERLRNYERNPRHNPDRLREAILNLRMAYPGTPEAQEAAALWMLLPSPLDALQRESLSPEQSAKLPLDMVARCKPNGTVRSLAFHPNGKLLALGTDQGRIVLWDPVTGKQTDFAKHAGSVHVAFAPDGKTLASGAEGGDGTIRLWDTATRQAREPSLGTHTGWLSSLAFSPDGRFVASGGAGGTVILWDVASRKSVTLLRGESYPSVAFTPDAKTVAAVTLGTPVKRFELATAKLLGTLNGLGPRAIAYTPDGQTMAVGNGSLKLWQAADGKEKKSLENGIAGQVNVLNFSPDGAKLLAVRASGATTVWDCFRGKQIRQWQLSERTSQFAPDGRHVAAIGGSLEVYILRLPPK